MPPSASLFRSQTRGLLIRSWHWRKRQYCNIFCNLVVPPIALVLLSALSRAIKPDDFVFVDTELIPKGALAARPFNPGQYCVTAASSGAYNSTLQCLSSSLNLGKPHYTIPFYAPPDIAADIGRASASSDESSGLLSAFSLDPFVYPPAADNSSTFYRDQNPYDGSFLHSLFQGLNDTSAYQSFVLIANLTRFDKLYNSSSFSLDSLQSFREHMYDSWLDGFFAPLYSTALTFDRFSRTDNSISVGATVFYNESETSSNCTRHCPIAANVIRTHNAIYKQVMPDNEAVAYLRRMPRVDPYEDLGIIQLVISIMIGLFSHFLLPTFMRFLVFERASRMRAMMSSMGLRRWQYWFGTYFSLLFEYLLSLVIVIIVGYAMNISFYTENAAISYIFLFFLWYVLSLSFMF